jgi:uncharacterized protein YndB with AHSA1/START domain
LRPYRFDDTFHFDAPMERLWAAITDTASYRTWWTWLRELDSPGLIEGTTSRCRIRSPLGYSVRFTIAIAQVNPRRHVAAQVTGDIEGTATVDLGGDTDVHLVWEVTVHSRLLRLLSLFARPLLRWGHNVLIARGARSLREAVTA